MGIRESRLFFEEDLINARPSSEANLLRRVDSTLQPFSTKVSSSLLEGDYFESERAYFLRPEDSRSSDDEFIQNLSQCTQVQLHIDGAEMNCDEGDGSPSMKFEDEHMIDELEARGIKRKTVIKIESDSEHDDILLSDDLHPAIDRPCTSASTYTPEKRVKAIARKRYKTSLGSEIVKSCKYCNSSVTS